MASKYFAILTNLGAAKLANATALGTQLEITHMAVGDGGGDLPIPNPTQTALIGERRRAAINLLTIDPLNNSQIISEQVIPEDVGGWWIREVGLFDKDGTLVAIANCPETYKPQLQEGSGRTQTIRVILIVSSTQSVSLKIDPSVVLATRKYVDDRVIEIKSYCDGKYEDLVLRVEQLKKYGAPLIGELIEWPHQLMPHEVFPDIGMEFIPYIGQPFDKVRFPLLAKLHPSGVLPADMRGEGVRGWDNNRGVDAGRALMSLQLDSIQNFTGSISGRPLSADATGAIASSSGVFKYTKNGGSSGASPVVTGSGVNALDLITLDLASQVRVSTETRGRTVAWNMITRSL